MTILLIFILFNYSQCMFSEIYYKVNPNQNHCIYEFFANNVLVIIEASSNIKQSFNINDNNNVSIFSDSDSKYIKYTFTTVDPGFYSFCVFNNSKAISEEKEKNSLLVSTIKLILKYGVFEKDYSSVSTLKNLKPIELDVSIINIYIYNKLQIIENKTEELYHLLNYSLSNEKLFSYLYENLIHNLRLYFIIIITITFAISFSEFVYLKNYFNKRKLI
jgi:hypothetical protein